MSRSPIDIMIDRACGIPDDWEPPPKITLRCPVCLREKVAPLDKTDPKGTAVVIYPCGAHGGEGDEVRYLDARGAQVLPT